MCVCSMAFDLDIVHRRVLEATEAGQKGVGIETKESLRDIYEAELLDWTDNYDEICRSSPNSEQAIYARRQIANLWYSYGRMEESFSEGDDRSLEVWEKAINDPFGSTQVGIYTSFAGACALSDPQKARKIYMSGVSSSSQLSVEDVATLWEVFFDWSSKQTLGTSLTLEEFKKNVKDEMDVTPPSSDDEVDDSTSSDVFFAPAESKETCEQFDLSSASRNHHHHQQLLQQQHQQALMTPEVLIKRHGKRPMMLFSAPNSDFMTMGATPLTEDEIKSLEDFIGCSILQLRDKGSWLLDILEGLWFNQALEEKKFEALFSELKALHAREESELEKKIMDPMHNRGQLQGDQKRHQSKSMVQQEVLFAHVNEKLLSHLRGQFEVLSEIGFPSATMALYERIELATIASSGKAAPLGSVAEPDTGLKEIVYRLQLALGALLSARFVPSTWDATIADKKGSASFADVVDPATVDPRKRRKV